MLQNDLVAIDCKAGTGYKCFNNPYAMDFSESPVTCCRYHKKATFLLPNLPHAVHTSLYRYLRLTWSSDGESNDLVLFP